MQETNLIMWRKCDQFQMGSNFAAWMMRIAYLQTLTYQRKLAKEDVFIGDEDFLGRLAAEAVESTKDTGLHERRQEALRRCIEKLPDRQREIVRSRYSEGSSIKTIAESLSLAATAVKQVLYRARISLISCVEIEIKEGS